MKCVKFQVPIFDVNVILIQVERIEDKDEVANVMLKNRISNKKICEVEDSIGSDCSDGAVTFSNKDSHTAIIVFYKMESYKRKLVCYSHEKRHLEDKILSFCGIDDMETSGYIAGWLALKFKELFDKCKISKR